MVNSPQWVSVDLNLGFPVPGQVWAPESTDVTQLTIPIPPNGTVGQFRDIGSTYLGVGTFIWLPGVANTVAGDWVTYSTSDGTSTGGATVRWAGTAASGSPLAVATAATVAAKYGWYQIGGAAITNTSGSIAVNAPLYFSGLTAVAGGTSIAGTQILRAVASSAQNIPATGQNIVTMSRPMVQSQIT